MRRSKKALSALSLTCLLGAWAAAQTAVPPPPSQVPGVPVSQDGGDRPAKQPVPDHPRGPEPAYRSASYTCVDGSTHVVTRADCLTVMEWKREPSPCEPLCAYETARGPQGRLCGGTLVKVERECPQARRSAVGR